MRKMEWNVCTIYNKDRAIEQIFNEGNRTKFIDGTMEWEVYTTGRLVHAMVCMKEGK